jgi:hypothetical protein
MFQSLSAYQKDLEGFRLLNSCHAKIHPIALGSRLGAGDILAAFMIMLG